MKAKFVRDNLVLVIGLTLPVLLMAGFLAVSALPGSLSRKVAYFRPMRGFLGIRIVARK